MKRTATNGDVGTMGTSGMKRIIAVGLWIALAVQLLHDMAVAENRNQWVSMVGGSAVDRPALLREERDLVLRTTMGMLRSEAEAIVTGIFRDLGLHQAMKWIAVKLDEVQTCHHLVGVLLSESRAVGPTDEGSLLRILEWCIGSSTTVVCMGKASLWQ